MALSCRDQQSVPERLLPNYAYAGTQDMLQASVFDLLSALNPVLASGSYGHVRVMSSRRSIFFLVVICQFMSRGI